MRYLFKNTRRLIGALYACAVILGLAFVICTAVFSDGSASGSAAAAGYSMPHSFKSTVGGVNRFDIEPAPDDVGVTTLAFFTNHQSVEVFAGDELVYSRVPSGGMFGRTTGSAWNFAHLSTEQLDAGIRVELTPIYASVSDFTPVFYAGDHMAIYTALINRSLAGFCASVITSIMGVIMLVYWVVINMRNEIGRSMLYLGAFSLLLGLWSANETDVTALTVSNRTAASAVAFILLMLIGIPFVMYVKESLRAQRAWVWKAIAYIYVLNFFVSTALMLLGVCDFKESCVVTHGLLVLTIFYFMGLTVARVRRRQADVDVWLHIVGLTFLTLICVIDFARYYMGYKDVDVIGRFAFLLYIAALGQKSANESLALIKRGRDAEIYQRLAVTDSLTGMMNRNAYVRDIDMNPRARAFVTLATFDLNDLKKCNDTFGHTAGDVYIKSAAEIIQDVFAPFGSCYRIGGDEFCVLMKNISRSRMEMLLKEMQRCEEEYNKSCETIPMRIACGYASFDKHLDEDLEQTRSRADSSMYSNKSALKAAYDIN